MREGCRRCGETVAVDERTMLGGAGDAGGRDAEGAADGPDLVGEDVVITDGSSAYHGRRGTVTGVTERAFGRRDYAVSVGDAELRGVDEDDVARLTGPRYVGLAVRRSLKRVRSRVGGLTRW